MSARFHPYLCGRNAAEWLIDMTRQGLTEYIAAIRGANRAVMVAARRRQAELAKPPGSLGRLEDYSVRMVGITGEVKPTLEKCRVLVLAADNGVVAEGVSSAPQSEVEATGGRIGLPGGDRHRLRADAARRDAGA